MDALPEVHHLASVVLCLSATNNVRRVVGSVLQPRRLQAKRIREAADFHEEQTSLARYRPYGENMAQRY